MAGEESWLRRTQRGYHIFSAAKDPKTEEKRQVALSIIISYLTAKCGGNVHDRGVIEITASSNSDIARNAGEFGTDWFCWSEDGPGEFICLDYKTFSIESTHDTMRTLEYGEDLKSWVTEASDDAVSWTEIDRHENNTELNRSGAVKVFAVSRSGIFGRILLRQNGLNHKDGSRLALSTFKVHGADAGLR
jgi:hypothetical protein